MTTETLSATAAILLSLAFSYLPGLSTAYQGLSSIHKRLVMLALLVLTAVGVLRHRLRRVRRPARAGRDL